MQVLGFPCCCPIAIKAQEDASKFGFKSCTSFFVSNFAVIPF